MDRLEKASEILMAAPERVSAEERREAEQIFLELRLTRSPFSLCREILETSQMPYLLFEAASLMRVAIIREFRDLSVEDRLQLRQYIMQYLLAHPQGLHYVREALIQAVAIMVKRGSVEDKGKEREVLLAEVEQLIQSSDNNMRVIGCSIVNALLQEYAITIKSADVGITWETHFAAKKQFEGGDLKRLFQFMTRLLHETTSALESGSSEGSELQELRVMLLRLLVMTEAVLSWTFITLHLPKRLMSVFEQDQNPSLRPGAQWEEVFKQEGLLPLFFKAYWLARTDWELGHHALNCLVQLSSLNGAVLPNKASRTDYLTKYLTCFFSLLDSIEIRECEAIGIAQITRKLVQFFIPSVMVTLPSDLLQMLFTRLPLLACQYAEKAAVEEAADSDEQVFGEGFEQILHSWTCILQEAWSAYHASGGSDCDTRLPNENVPARCLGSLLVTTGPTMLSSLVNRMRIHGQVPADQHVVIENLRFLFTRMQEGARLVFDTFVKCHLAPPNGIRRTSCITNEITDLHEDDRKLYRDQLQNIGINAKQDMQHSLEVITTLLDRTIGHFEELLFTVEHSLEAVVDSEAQYNLYEDLHWLVLLACHVLTSGNDGDSELIPTEVLGYSLECAPHTDVKATIDLMMSVDSRTSITADNSSTPTCGIDPIVRLFVGLLRLARIEQLAVASGGRMKEAISPEVSASVLWALRNFCISFLLPNESLYSEISPALNAAFGLDSEGAAWVLQFMLGCVEQTLRHRVAEPDLVTDAIALLIALVDHQERGKMIVKFDGLFQVVHLQQSGQLGSLSSSATRGLTQGLVLLTASASSSDPGMREELYSRMLLPLLSAFHALLEQGDFMSNYHSDVYRRQILHHLDIMTGAARGCLMSTASSLFDRLTPSLAALVRLLDLYHNYPVIVEAILEVYLECGRRLLCYLSRDASTKLYQGTVEIIRVYAKHNIGRRVLKSQGADDDQWRDLKLLMELLTAVLSKDFIDLAPPPSRTAEEDTSDDAGQEDVAAADVCLYGLNIIMPLMSRELLQIPSLCSPYFKMITFIAEIYPSKICDLPPDLLKNLLVSVELGLTEFGLDMTTFCFDFLFVLVQFVFKFREQQSPIRLALQPFLKLLLDLILSQQIPSDVIQVASAALYMFICCYQDDYHSLVSQLLANQADRDVATRLADAFTQLTCDVPLTGDRSNKIIFRSNFENFLANVRGFLFVK